MRNIAFTSGKVPSRDGLRKTGAGLFQWYHWQSDLNPTINNNMLLARVFSIIFPVFGIAAIGYLYRLLIRPLQASEYGIRQPIKHGPLLSRLGAGRAGKQIIRACGLSEPGARRYCRRARLRARGPAGS